MFYAPPNFFVPIMSQNYRIQQMPDTKKVCVVMIKPQKSNLDNLIVVLVWFVLYIEDTFSPRMHWLWVKILVFSLSPLSDIFCSYYESKLLYTTNAWYQKKKKKELTINRIQTLNNWQEQIKLKPENNPDC